MMRTVGGKRQIQVCQNYRRFNVIEDVQYEGKLKNIRFVSVLFLHPKTEDYKAPDKDHPARSAPHDCPVVLSRPGS